MSLCVHSHLCKQTSCKNPYQVNQSDTHTHTHCTSAKNYYLHNQPGEVTVNLNPSNLNVNKGTYTHHTHTSKLSTQQHVKYCIFPSLFGTQRTALTHLKDAKWNEKLSNLRSTCNSSKPSLVIDEEFIVACQKLNRGIGTACEYTTSSQPGSLGKLSQHAPFTLDYYLSNFPHSSTNTGKVDGAYQIPHQSCSIIIFHANISAPHPYLQCLLSG